MNFDFNKAKLAESQIDIRKKIKYPKNLSWKLSEFIGIMVGDGHLGSYTCFNKKGYKSVKSSVVVSGNMDEYDYHNYIKKMFVDLFNTEMIYAKDNGEKAVVLRCYSKGLLNYLHRICQIPLNRKTEIVRIPEKIQKSNIKVKAAFLRGLADSDFSLCFQNKNGKGHNYPVISGSFRSKMLIQDLEILLVEMGFRHSVYYHQQKFDRRFNRTLEMHNIYLYGVDNLLKWISKIGFSNKKFSDKVNTWFTPGYCAPIKKKAPGESCTLDLVIS